MDLAQYKNGLKTALNCNILPQGPIARRNGSQYIAATKNNGSVRLVEFQFSQTNSYIIEVGNTYMRFYKNGAQIQVTGTPYEITSPYTTAELFQFTYKQFGTSIYFAHPNHPPQQLFWQGDTNWSMNPITFFPVATAENGFKPAATLTPGATTGTGITFTASSGVFLAADVGRQIHYINNNGIASITSITDSSHVVCDIIQDFPNTSAIASQSWKMDLSPVAFVVPNATTVGDSIHITSVKPGVGGVVVPQSAITPSATTGTNVLFFVDQAVISTANIGQVICNKNGPGKAIITSVDAPQPITGGNASNPQRISMTDTSGLRQSGDKIYITGQTLMQQITNRYFLVGGVQSATDITLDDTAGNGVDGTGYGTANSSGTVQNLTIKATILEAFTSTGTLAETTWELRTPIDAFRSADVGNYLVLNNGIVKITSLVSAQEVIGTILKSLNSINGTNAWSLESPAWSNTLGYPAVVGIHQQRLVLASTSSSPESLWLSESGVFTSMGTGSNDSDAIQEDLTSSDPINWVMQLRGDLLLGSFKQEMSINAGGTQGTITPATFSELNRSYYGGNVQQPIVIGFEGLFVQKSQKKIMSLAYNFLVDTYEGKDLTLFSEHIAAGLVKQMVWVQDPDKHIMAVLQDGTIIVCTYYKDQQLQGWTRYSTNGQYQSIQTISTGAYAEVWVVVTRIVNGSTVNYIERFDTGDGSSPIDGFSDCYLSYYNPIAITGITQANPAVVTAPSHGLNTNDTVKIINMGTAATKTSSATGMYEITNKTYTVTKINSNSFSLNVDSTHFSSYVSGGSVVKLVTTISGISHLEGMTVQVKQDGATAANKTVSSGSITLDTPGYAVTVGLPYNMQVHTLSKEYDLGIGTQQGQPIRFVRPILRLLNSAYPTLNGNPAPSRSPLNNMDHSLPLFTGDLSFGGLTWDRYGEFDIQTSLPFPCILCGIFGSLDGGSI